MPDSRKSGQNLKREQKMFVLLKLVAIYEGPPDDRKKAVKRCHNLAPALSFFAARTVQAFLLRAFVYLMICIRVEWCLWCEYKRRTGHLPNPLFKLTFYYFVCKGGKRPIFVESGNSVWILPRVQINVFFSGPDNSVWVLTQVKNCKIFWWWIWHQCLGPAQSTNGWIYWWWIWQQCLGPASITNGKIFCIYLYDVIGITANKNCA